MRLILQQRRGPANPAQYYHQGLNKVASENSLYTDSTDGTGFFRHVTEEFVLSVRSAYRKRKSVNRLC